MQLFSQCIRIQHYLEMQKRRRKFLFTVGWIPFLHTLQGDETLGSSFWLLHIVTTYGYEILPRRRWWRPKTPSDILGEQAFVLVAVSHCKEPYTPWCKSLTHQFWPLPNNGRFLLNKLSKGIKNTFHQGSLLLFEWTNQDTSDVDTIFLEASLQIITRCTWHAIIKHSGPYMRRSFGGIRSSTKKSPFNQPLP